MYSGRFTGGAAFGNQGTSGFGSYWSSTVSNATNSHNLAFDASSVNPASNNSKGYGLAVRCVAE